MNKLARVFYSRCSSIFGAMGFIKVKGAMVRLNDDIIHAFSLKHIPNVPECTVVFCIHPLCDNVPVYLDDGDYELGEFCTKWEDTWRYDPKAYESIESCVEQLIHMMTENLIPLFDKCRDCRSALRELMGLEELFNTNRIRKLETVGARDCAEFSWQERALFDATKFYMALKSQDYAFAERYLSFNISQKQALLEKLDRPEAPKQPESVKIKISKRIEELLELHKRIVAGDYAYFENMLCENEAKNKEWLLDQYPPISKLIKNA